MDHLTWYLNTFEIHSTLRSWSTTFLNYSWYVLCNNKAYFQEHNSSVGSCLVHNIGQVLWKHLTHRSKRDFILIGEHIFVFLVLRHLKNSFIFSLIQCHGHGGWEIMVHNIWIVLNIHIEWVMLHVDIANAFNIVFCRSFLGAPKIGGSWLNFSHLFKPFMINNSPYYLVIIAIWETLWLSIPPLAHHKMIHGEGFFLSFANYLTNFFFSCLFFPIYDDIDLIGLTLVALRVFEHLHPIWH